MKATLDPSHRTVLENLDAFQRAERCMREIQDNLREVLDEVAAELTDKHGPGLRFRQNKDGWLQAEAFPDWQGTGRVLIAIGVEGLTVRGIIAPTASEACRAYVFSPVLEDRKWLEKHASFAPRLRALPAPADFVDGDPNSDGYLFAKPLDKLSAESFCSRSELKRYFREPLGELAKWLTANTPTLASLKKSPATTRK